jgi:FlaA1/EpsC-like NDP-sugar epimerase
MTIPEAAQLVMQAGAMAKGGEIFILDMGEPVKIIDLAHDLIRLSGYTPDEDVDIKITGLRPGEKLFEELLLSEEGLEQTPHNKIHIGKPQLHDMSYLTRQLIRLKELIETGAGPDIREGLKSMVPEYTFEKEESMSRVIEFKRIDNR